MLALRAVDRRVETGADHRSIQHAIWETGDRIWKNGRHPLLGFDARFADFLGDDFEFRLIA